MNLEYGSMPGKAEAIGIEARDIRFARKTPQLRDRSRSNDQPLWAPPVLESECRLASQRFAETC
jgi:hypothetical protein